MSVILKNLYILLLVSSCNVGVGKCNNDLLLTADQTNALSKFKALVIDKIPPKNAYMTAEAYLIKWLRAASFDVNSARHVFRQNLRWREENGMDNILNVDFSDVIMNYSIEEPDEQGRPVLLIRIASWDISHSATAGNRDRFEGAVYRMLEDVNTRVRKVQAEGKPVTRYSIVVDLKGFNLPRHGCFPCIPVYTALVLGLEEHYPQSVGRAAFINTPRVFEFLLNVLRAAMSKELKGILEVYGSDRQTWPADLAKYAILETRPAYNLNGNFGLGPQPQVQLIQPLGQQIQYPQQQPQYPQQQPQYPQQQPQYPQQQPLYQQQPQYPGPISQEQRQYPGPLQDQNQSATSVLTIPNRIRYKSPVYLPVTGSPFQYEDEFTESS